MTCAVVLLMQLTGLQTLAHSVVDCKDQLQKASHLFDEGQFSKVIALSEECVKRSDLPQDLRVSALDLLAQSLIKLRDTSLSRKIDETIQEILRIRPGFIHDSRAEVAYVNLIERNRSALPRPDTTGAVSHKTNIERFTTEPSDGGLWTWLAVGAGVVVAAVIVIAATQ